MSLYGAYELSINSYYEDDGGGSDSNERLIDADANIETLCNRVNEHFAKPDVMQFYRNQLCIPKGKSESNSYNGS